MNNAAANYYAALSTADINEKITRIAGRIALGEEAGGTRGLVAAIGAALGARIGDEDAGRFEARAAMARLDRVLCMLG